MFQKNTCDETLNAWLTIRVQLIWVKRQPAVVLLIGNAVVVVVMVARVTLAILVVVYLVGVGYVGAVVQVVLVAVLVNVLVVVALVSDEIRVRVKLQENRIPLGWDFPLTLSDSKTPVTVSQCDTCYRFKCSPLFSGMQASAIAPQQHYTFIFVPKLDE